MCTKLFEIKLKQFEIFGNLMTGTGSLLQFFEANNVFGQWNAKNDLICLHSCLTISYQILCAVIQHVVLKRQQVCKRECASCGFVAKILFVHSLLCNRII